MPIIGFLLIKLGITLNIFQLIITHSVLLLFNSPHLILNNKETLDLVCSNNTIDTDISIIIATNNNRQKHTMDTIELAQHQSQHPHYHQSSTAQQQSTLIHQNLFILQNQQDNHPSISHTRKVKSFRKITYKKTPAQIIKQSILKNRQNKRVDSLKAITKDNIKIFLRLQEQKSEYNFTQLHKQLSTTILPLSRSKISNLNGETISVHRISRCQSAAPSLKFRCKSLKNNISSNATSRTHNMMSRQQEGQSSMHMFGSRASKINNDKQNMIVNKESANLTDEQSKILIKKMCLKIPNSKQNLTNKLINHKIGNLEFTLKSRPKMVDRQKKQRGVLVEMEVNKG